MWPIAIVGHLKPGWEDIGTIAARLSRFFEKLAEVDPLFSRWVRIGTRRHHSIVPAFVTMPPEQTELCSWIDENRIFGSRAGRKETVGYFIRVLTPAQNPIRADFWLNFLPEDWWFGHRIGITIFSGVVSLSPLDDPGTRQMLIALLPKVLLIAGLAWDCDWAGVSPGDYRTASERPPDSLLCQYQSGWMVSLDPASATRIVPPQDIAIENLHNGGMLMIAAPNTLFDAHKQDHWAAALRIQAALAPLNAAENVARGV
jgi:Immunity protein 52